MQPRDVERWRYRNSNLSFNPDAEMVHKLERLEAKCIEKVSHEVVADLVYVTAASDDHFNESIDAIASLQNILQDTRIIYFDLGLSLSSINQVLHYCNNTVLKHFFPINIAFSNRARRFYYNGPLADLYTD